MAVETNARIEFSVASVEEWEKVNPKLHQGEPVFAKKPSGKYILKVGAPGGSTYKNAVVVWDQDDAETKMTRTQEAAAQALASKNVASASASAAKASENAAAASKSAAAKSEVNAKTSETNAAASKTSAANSASTASSKATASANSASAAATSETNAAGSASAAATSESNALKSASAANTSAGNAKGSETNASASAMAAAQSASAAAQSAENAARFDPAKYLESKFTLGYGTDDNPQTISIPLEKGLYSIVGYPDGFTAADKKYPYALVANLEGYEGAILSLYAQDLKKELYFRVGWEGIGWRSGWAKLATTESVDTKVGNVWKEPLKWDEYTEPGQIMPNLSSLAMTTDGTFARVSYGILAGIITSSIPLYDYVLKSDYAQEAQKWKDAYNNLRKRSYPTEFDDDELTLLMDTPLVIGTITLSQPYTDFDGLLIEYTDDNSNAFNRQYISTAELNYRIARSIAIKGGESGATISLISGEQYWRIWCGKSRGFTTTTFPAWTENSVIYRIYGVKFKEIT